MAPLLPKATRNPASGRSSGTLVPMFRFHHSTLYVLDINRARARRTQSRQQTKRTLADECTLNDRLRPLPASGRNSNRRHSALLKTLPAQDRPSLRRLEGNSRFRSASRTVRPRLRPHGRTARSPLDLALFTALWIVLELLVVEKKLFAGSKDKVTAAITAFQ